MRIVKENSWAISSILNIFLKNTLEREEREGVKKKRGKDFEKFEERRLPLLVMVIVFSFCARYQQPPPSTEASSQIRSTRLRRNPMFSRLHCFAPSPDLPQFHAHNHSDYRYCPYHCHMRAQVRPHMYQHRNLRRLYRYG